MTLPIYRWLVDALAPTFTVRHPWVDAVRRATGSAESACVLIPEAAGDLAGWGVWLEGELEESRPAVAVGPDFAAAAAALEQLSGVERTDIGRPTDWVATFLPAARRAEPHVATVPLLVVNPTPECVSGLTALVQTQRAITYPLVRLVIVARSVPDGWAGETIRFSLPEPVGDLHRNIPHPVRDLDYWTSAVLALAAVWEAGAVPALADELWHQLCGTRILSPRDPGFDDWLVGRLEGFARSAVWSADLTIPDALAYAPVRPDASYEPSWHAGAMGYADGWFDLTPVRARGWALALPDSCLREAVARRRLVNAPLARWLAAWAASVEEALRVLTLRAGCAQFRAYLRSAAPRYRGGADSRLEELAPEPSDSLVGLAEFGDLSRFLAGMAGRVQGRVVADLLERCRIARNRVIHRRTATASDLLDIATAVDWLATQGLI